MAVTNFLARDIAIEIETSPGTFTPIAGIETLSHSPATVRAMTTDFDANGRPTHIPAERGDSWSIAGFTKEDVATGDRDPGQADVEALAKGVGLTAIGTFRMTSPGGNTATFDASAEVTLAGGGKNDAATWAAKVEITGAVVYA